MSDAPHVPVMLAEVTAALAARPGEIIVDGTFGAGGYTRALLQAGANVVAIDRDPSAVAAGRAAERASAGRLRLVEGRFSALDEHVGGLGIAAADGVVLDLGVSSMQLDRAERGFSFMRDGPLDMRMGGDGPTAADLLARLPERALADVLFRYGEERKSRQIAAAIVRRRGTEPVTRTRDLADLVARVVGRSWKDQSHPATRTFQALRIAVNRELEEVAAGLASAERVLRPGGRLVVVAFHSLEDRIVKAFLAARTQTASASRHMPSVSGPAPSFATLTRKALAVSEAEAAANPRARSAKLRAAMRTDQPAHALDLAALGVIPLDDLISRARR
jgi:16S rRNA (cytosine1402-N4)-methyltransferase